MRSLYTDDILGIIFLMSGAKHKPTILDKGYYKQQHDLVVQRSSRNLERKNQYEWYVPLPKPEKPTYSHEPQSNTIKLISEHTGLSRSGHYESLKKGNSRFDNSWLSDNYSLLSQSALNNVHNRK